MEASVEKLAIILHDSWRAEKIKGGWHIPKDCEKDPVPCNDCHPCVDAWENLTDKEKELALLNAKLAHDYFKNPKLMKIPTGDEMKKLAAKRYPGKSIGEIGMQGSFLKNLKWAIIEASRC